MKSIIYICSVWALGFLLINCDGAVEELDPRDLTGPPVNIEELIMDTDTEENPVGENEVNFTPLFEATIDGRNATLINFFRDGQAINSFFNENAVYIEVSINGNPAEATIIFSIDRSDVGVGTYELGENSVYQFDYGRHL